MLLFSICNTYEQFLVRKDIIREYKQLIETKIDVPCLETFPEYLHRPRFSEESNVESDDTDKEEFESTLVIRSKSHQ